jgi:hypothetical protein
MFVLSPAHVLLDREQGLFFFIKILVLGVKAKKKKKKVIFAE